MVPTSIDGLTMPAAGIDVLRAVLNQHWRMIVADYLALPRRQARLQQGVPALVERLLAVSPRGVVRAMRRPNVAAFVGAAHRAGAVDPEGLAAYAEQADFALLTELAMSGVLQERHACVTTSARTLRSISWTQEASVPRGARLVFAPGEIHIEVPSGIQPLSASPVYHPIVGPIRFALRDDNPLISVQGHPDREGNRVDLGGHEVESWLGALRAAFELVAAHAPHSYEEMRLALELVVPVGYAEEQHFSVSYRDSVGAVYMTLHPNVMTLAEALIHEFQHAKLNAVMHWDPILMNSREASFASPVRPDPRPLLGVLMAVHAFLPVARLYESMVRAEHPLTRGRDFDSRFRAIVRTNREGAQTLRENARPTTVGSSLIREIRRCDAYYVEFARTRWGDGALD